MKMREFHKFLLLLAIFIIISCQKNEIENKDIAGQKITVIGENIEPDTKTTLSGLSSIWIANDDKVGIYSPQARPASDGAAGVTNAQFSAVTSTSSSVFTGEMYWGTGSHSFYAYYPYSAGSPSSSSIPVSLSYLQTQSEGGNSSHIGLLDFMVATPLTGVTPGTEGQSAGVSLFYNHLFTMLEFQIKRSSGSGDITELRFTARNKIAFDSGTIDISQTKPATGAAYNISTNDTKNEIVLSLTTAVAPTSDYTTTPKIFMMINPKSETGYITITLKSGSTYKYVQKKAPAGGFERGKKYIVQIDAALATDYPGSSVTLDNMPTIASVKWAPVNCGYNPENTYGYYYQWHRKYGQKSVCTNVAGPVSLAVGNDPANIDNFYYISTSLSDWCNTTQVSWSSDQQYNPCPIGWRLPSTSELQTLLASGYTWENAGGSGIDLLAGCWIGGNHASDHIGSVFLPAGGFKNIEGSAANNVGSACHYYSSVAATSDLGDRLYIAGATSSVSGSKKARGNSVRCVK